MKFPSEIVSLGLHVCTTKTIRGKRQTTSCVKQKSSIEVVIDFIYRYKVVEFFRYKKYVFNYFDPDDLSARLYISI